MVRFKMGAIFNAYFAFKRQRPGEQPAKGVELLATWRAGFKKKCVTGILTLLRWPSRLSNFVYLNQTYFDGLIHPAMVTKTENKNPALELGSKIRALRQRLKRTLDDTATAARISKPFLSQVERGLATPSLTSLAGIASALGVTVQYFVDTPSEERSVSRGDQLKFFGFADSANLFARLTNLTGGRQLEAILVKMPPGQKRSEVNTHAGEEFLYVISGKVSLTLEGKTFSLQAGDSAHYESTVPHSWANTARGESLVVWVGTPRLF